VKAVCARFFSSTFRDRTRSDLLCVDWNVRPRLESGSLLCTLSSQWTISCDFDDDEAATAGQRQWAGQRPQGPRSPSPRPPSRSVHVYQVSVTSRGFRACCISSRRLQNAFIRDPAYILLAYILQLVYYSLYSHITPYNFTRTSYRGR